MKFVSLAVAALMCVVSFAAQAETTSAVDQRAAIVKMEAETLAKLYKENPDAKNEIENAAGYAVFSTGEMAIIWVSAGYGHGVAHSKGGNDIYMQMAKAGVGLGLGAKDFHTVFVFQDKDTYTKFTTTGLDLSGTADVAVKSGEKGDSMSGAANVLPGTRIYQLTDTGLMAQAMLQGTKYWRDDALNDSAAKGE